MGDTGAPYRPSTARHTAEAAVDDRPAPRKLHVVGSVVDFARLVRDHDAGPGVTRTVERRGSVDELRPNGAVLPLAEPAALADGAR